MVTLKVVCHRAVISLVTTAALVSSAEVRSQQIDWVKHYGTPTAHVQGFRLVADGQGNIYGTGAVSGYGPIDMDGHTASWQGTQDIVIAKWDSMGTNQWVRTVGGTPVQDDWDQGELIAYDSLNDRILVTGKYNSQADFGCAQFTEQNDQRSIFTASYHPDGTCDWVRAIRGPAVYNHCALLDHQSDVHWFGESILAGPQFVGFPSTTIPYGGFVARYDAQGQLKSAKRMVNFGGVRAAEWADSTHWLVNIQAVEGTTLYGQDLGVTTTGSGVLAMVDTSDSVLWFQRYEGSNGFGNGGGDCAVVGNHAIVVGRFGGDLLFNGSTYSSPLDEAVLFIASYSLSGEPEWIVPFEAEGSVLPSRDLLVDEQGTIYFFGIYSDTLMVGPMEAIPAGESSSFLARFDTLGNCLSAFYFGPSNAFAGSIARDGDDILVSAPYGGNVTFGPVTLPATNSVMLAKLDTLMGYTGVGPSFMALQENLLIYANPNNGLCSVQLPTHLQFTNGLLLSIFDQTGHLVQRVPVTVGNAGVQVDIQAQAKGLYHVELGDGRQRYTGTIVFE